MLYVIGAPQALHLNMVWDTARKAGWLPEDVTPVHVQIGNVLGEDRKILKTRSGSSLRLMALLDEAVAKARALIDETRPDLDEEERATIARQVGIGAVKYADLSVAHDSEYVFDLDRMVAFTGNTGPYLQYVVARIRSIFRQAGLDPVAQHAPITLGTPHERALAISCSVSRTSSRRSGRSTSRTGSVATCSSWRRRSPRSTRTAPSSRPRPTSSGSPGSR